MPADRRKPLKHREVKRQTVGCPDEVPMEFLSLSDFSVSRSGRKPLAPSGVVQRCASNQESVTGSLDALLPVRAGTSHQTTAALPRSEYTLWVHQIPITNSVGTTEGIWFHIKSTC